MDPDKLEVGELVTDVFLIAKSRLGTDRRGQNYYTLTVNCAGGKQLEAKIWSDNIGAPLEVGQAIEALARVDEYMGDTQLNIQRYEVIPPEEFDPSPYVRSSDIDADAAFNTLFDWQGDDFSNPYLKRLMKELYENEGFARSFKTSPAASHHHHNYLGGLAEHTLEVWELAERFCAQYEEQINRELMLAGAALHDIGKIRCYELLSGVSEHTDEGYLLNHIFISSSMISNLWDRNVTPEVESENKEEASELKHVLLHIILSHHGKKEWGSPVIPQTPEALLIHYCDQISATMRTCFDAMEEIPEGESWTDWLLVMDNRRKLFAPER
ncbi:MAG: HD domain-containing protein [Planctomycetes bacterium]|nr:HD domain-containing protein [Planctomycetota bacterium]